jgi:tRNA pseudouridine38-40 synthase
MATYKSIIGYDGTEFRGFQRQAEPLRTVQGVIEEALRKIGWREESLRAAGRTDAGVHARGQVIAFACDWNHATDDLTRALNANLPSDVVVKSTSTAPDRFHPRFSALKRRYCYQLLIAPRRDPFRERFAWRIWPEPGLEIMLDFAQALKGEHDFGAFGSAPSPGGNTRRRVIETGWSRNHEEWTFTIEADAFLYRMVRRLVAALVDIGLGKVDLQAVECCLSDPAEKWVRSLAPPRGLFLDEVVFD